MNREKWTWAFSTLGCPELDLPGAVALAKRFNISSLELRMFENNLNLPQYFKEKYGEPQKLADYLAGESINACTIDTSLFLCTATDKERNELLEFIPWAKALGVNYLRVFEGGKSKDKTDTAEIRAMAETVKWWRELREKEGWSTDIMVETHDACVNSKNLAALQNEVGEPLKILWDTHHPWHQIGEELETTWKALGTETVHLHVKDSILDESSEHGYLYVPPGKGRFPFNRLWKILRDANYSGTVSLEWEKKWRPEIAPIEEALQSMQDNGWI